jgi:hypothetical protein
VIEVVVFIMDRSRKGEASYHAHRGFGRWKSRQLQNIGHLSIIPAYPLHLSHGDTHGVENRNINKRLLNLG